MESIIKVLLAALVLLVVIVIYVAVSYLHSKSGLSGGCNGNCGSCHMHSKNCNKPQEDKTSKNKIR